MDAFRATKDLRTVLRDEPWTVQSVLVEHHPIEAAVGYRIGDGTATVAISGDTIVGPGVALLAQDADVLLHQALRTDLVTAEALRWNASARSVGELAAESQVARLILTHLMPAPANSREEQAFLDEARSGGYRGSISVAHDLDRFTLP